MTVTAGIDLFRTKQSRLKMGYSWRETMDNELHKTVFVPFLPQEAFHIFVNCIGEWWPLHSHTLADKDKGERSVAALIEPHDNGRIYETLQNGQQREWGKVVKYKLGEFVSLDWQVGCPDGEATEVEVIFSPAGPQTKIDLFHRHWERFGDKAETMKDEYDKGWNDVLHNFISYAATHEAA